MVKSFVAEVTFSRRPQNQKINKICRRKMVLQSKYFPQNVTSLPKRAKIVIPCKATQKFVPPAYRKGVAGGEATKYS